MYLGVQWSFPDLRSYLLVTVIKEVNMNFKSASWFSPAGLPSRSWQKFQIVLSDTQDGTRWAKYASKNESVKK